ncbi:hypothetical protein, partial [Kitasatospora putterlickiae]|uniref:hypothetical protein n=1 Tax=Kitasatospora putterlickiae TaxID=221725 RepID=UPI0031E30907
ESAQRVGGGEHGQAAPLEFGDDAAARVQVTLGQADAEGGREVAVYSRPDSGDEPFAEAVCHARGWLAAEGAAPAAWLPTEWPPA